VNVGADLRAVMFDMDGTLVSTLSTFLHCLNEISLRYKKESLGLEDIVPKFGPPAMVIVRGLTGALPEDLQNRAISDFYDCWKKNARDKVIVFPGIQSLLQDIRSSGKRLGLVTGIEKVMMESTPQALRVGQVFRDTNTSGRCPDR
jgi:phosphoglycolate phosphatase-like HAD superfamily hydrolase